MCHSHLGTVRVLCYALATESASGLWQNRWSCSLVQYWFSHSHSEWKNVSVALVFRFQQFCKVPRFQKLIFLLAVLICVLCKQVSTETIFDLLMSREKQGTETQSCTRKAKGKFCWYCGTFLLDWPVAERHQQLPSLSIRWRFHVWQIHSGWCAKLFSGAVFHF